MRQAFVDEPPSLQAGGQAGGGGDQGAARAISSFIDPALCWDDVPWLLSVTRLPVLLKGVQTCAAEPCSRREGSDGGPLLRCAR